MLKIYETKETKNFVQNRLFENFTCQSKPDGEPNVMYIVGIMQGVEGVSTRISHDDRITNERSRKAEFII